MLSPGVDSGAGRWGEETEPYRHFRALCTGTEDFSSVLARISWLPDDSCSGIRSNMKMTFKKPTGLFHIQTHACMSVQRRKHVIQESLPD